MRFTTARLSEPILGTVTEIVGTRAKVAPDDGTAPWSIAVEQLEILEDS